MLFQADEIFTRIVSTLTELNSKFGHDSVDGLRKFENRLRQIKTPGQWATYLHTAGSAMSKRPTRGRISVQPLSQARRQKIKRGGCHVNRIGRPPIRLQKAKIHKLSAKYYK